MPSVICQDIRSYTDQYDPEKTFLHFYIKPQQSFFGLNLIGDYILEILNDPNNEKKPIKFYEPNGFPVEIQSLDWSYNLPKIERKFLGDSSLLSEIESPIIELSWEYAKQAE